MKKILIFLLFFSFSTNVFTQSKKEVFEQLKNNLKNAKAVSLDFKSNLDKNQIGKLIATSTGQYKLFVGNRIIVCDGKTLWNYSSTEKKVLISDYEDMDMLSIETLFTEIITNYTAKTLKKETSTSFGKSFKLIISPKNKDAYNPEITLRLETTKYNIKSLGFDAGNGYEEWEISNMILKTQKESFEFKIPENTTIIDLR